MSIDERICQINLYRKDSDTPIVLYDKTNLKEDDIIDSLKYIFTSSQISVISTSSETVIIKPSQIDAITFINEIDVKKKNKINAKKNKLIETSPITSKINNTQENDKTENQDKLEVEEIDLNQLEIDINNNGVK